MIASTAPRGSRAIQRVHTLPPDPIAPPAAAGTVELRPARPFSLTRRPRLWKCRRRGNHRTISTAAWKSRTAREIPTFPQPPFV